MGVGLIACVSLIAAFASGMAAGPDIALSHIPDVLYPPIAQAARISGEIHVQVEVRPDGSVAWASILNPSARFAAFLAPRALDAARRARFTCRGCSEPLTSYRVIFVFHLADIGEKPRTVVETITPLESRVRVIVDSPICDHCGGGGTHQIQKGRSLRCLWLWQCASRGSRPPPSIGVF